MSPLARSLLALACAALLHAACAQSQCTSKSRGRDGRKIEFPLIQLNASLGRHICFNTGDQHGNKDYFCKKAFDNPYEPSYVLVGVSARACDWVVAPGLKIYEDLSLVCVDRNWNLEPDATLLIWEFCLPGPAR